MKSFSFFLDRKEVLWFKNSGGRACLSFRNFCAEFTMKKIIVILLLLAMAFMIMGCPFIISSSHTRSHTKAMNVHAVQIHQFIDRHFWLYDWQDPYVN